MTKDEIKLLKKLDAKALSTEVANTFFHLGKGGYDLLLASVREEGALSKWQAINAMEMLVRLRFHGDQNELFGVLLEITRDERVEVRSAATRFVMGLTVIAEQRPDSTIELANKAYVAPIVREALDRGLRTREFEASVRDFLGES